MDGSDFCSYFEVEYASVASPREYAIAIWICVSTAWQVLCKCLACYLLALSSSMGIESRSESYINVYNLHTD